MPFKPEYISQLINELKKRSKIKNRGDLAKRISECGLKHGLDVPRSRITLWHYEKENKKPNTDYLDALYFLAQENGLEGYEFYELPSNNKKTNIKKR